MDDDELAEFLADIAEREREIRRRRASADRDGGDEESEGKQK